MSARAFAAAVMLLGLTVACDRAGTVETTQSRRDGDRSSPVTSPEMRVDPVATAEPGIDRRQWATTSELGRSLAGNMTVSLEVGRGGPLVLAFANGITLRLERIADQIGADRTSPGGPTFASTLATDPNAGVYVYRVLEEKVVFNWKGGGLCQAKRTTHIAVSEFVNRNGEWVFVLAAYKGSQAPGPQATADPDLCAALGYATR